jgi:hypothetical protein
MNKGYKKAFSLFTAIFLFVTVAAQQNHFIYLQAENKQPFYIKLDKKVLSSTASGYLIIPKLQDGNYILTVGFPKNEWPEQNVTCTVNKKDAGYLLKNFGDKGWGFFNFQTMEVIMPGTGAVENKTAGDADKQDLFSNILSGVVNDPSIVKRVEEKPEIKDTVKVVENDIKKEDSLKTVVAAAEKPEANKTIGDKPAVKKEDPVNNVITVAEKPEANKTVEDKPAVKKEDSVKAVIAIAEKPELNKTIEDKPAVKKEEPVTEKPETNKIVEDKPVVKKDDPVRDIVVKDKEVVTAPSHIKKLFSVKSSEGTDIVYADISNGGIDTIRLFIPTEKIEVAAPGKKIEPAPVEVQNEEPPRPAIKKEEEKKELVSQPENKTADPVLEIVQKEEAKKEEPKKKVKPKKEEAKENKTKFIDIELPNPNTKKDTVTKQPATIPADEKKPELTVEKPKENISRPVIANSDCKNFASEDDFLKLRKKMAAAGNDDDMLSMSKKVFKSKCFTTEQVKNLAVLFLKDEGKYKFFDVAYPFVSDSYNFSTLESQLTDDYYISRFKAMIHH